MSWSPKYVGAQTTGIDPTVQEVERLAAEARQAYNLKDYSRSIAFYLKAYRLAPAGALLYNIAYIYDHTLGELDLAMNFYRRYIRSEDADPDVVQRATLRLSALKEVKKRTTGSATDRPIPPLDTGPSPGPGLRTPQQANGPVVQRTSKRSVWAWSLVGVGGAALAGGGVMATIASGTHNDFNAASTPQRKQELRDTGRSQALTADLLLGAGLAAITTGIVLLLTDSGPANAAADPGRSRWGLVTGSDGALIMWGAQW